MSFSAALLGVNVFAVLVAAILHMATGLLWYMPRVFGNLWSVLTGKDLKPAKQWLIVGALGHVTIALILAVLINLAQVTTPGGGLLMGALVWLGFIVTLEVGELIWEKIPVKLFLIRIAEHFISLGLAGIILAVWLVDAFCRGQANLKLYFVYLALCLIGIGIRTVYEILKKNGRVDTRNVWIFAAVFVAMALLLASWVFMCPLDPWRVHYGVAFRLPGLCVLLAGLGLAAGGLVQLKGLENIDHLVTNGLFARFRHPMYTGFIMWIWGWVVYYGAAMSLLVAVVSTLIILYWRHIEDGKLAAKYGNAYLAYRKGTWF